MRPDVDAEIRHHIRERADLLVEEGWEPEEALAEAHRLFGDPERVRRDLERISEGRGRLGRVAAWGRSAVGDLGYAVRGLRARPGFTASVVLTLALGIGAVTAIFTVVDAALVRPLPYRDADRLVEVDQSTDDGGYLMGVSTRSAHAWRQRASAFADAWIEFAPLGVVRTDGPVAERLTARAVAPGTLQLLGLPLLLGRTFVPDDAEAGSPDVVILNGAYYQRLGGDPGIVGRTLHLATGPVTVVGVLRGNAKFPLYGDPPDLWLVRRPDGTAAGSTVHTRPVPVARLRAGLDLAAAQARVDALAAAMDSDTPRDQGTWRVRLVPLDAHRANPDVRQALWTLMGTVTVIFLIALINGGNLLLVRTSERTRELAVRTALGGSRRRILRLLLAEGLTLGVAGGLVATGLAWAGVALVRGILPRAVTSGSPYAVTVEGRSLLLVFAASVLTGVVLGLLPGVRLLGDRRIATGPLSGRPGGLGRSGRRLQQGVVALQIALSMALLAGAGLFVKSFERLMAVNPGFDVAHIALADVDLSSTRYPDPADRADYVRRLRALLAARPDVQGVTVTDGPGFSFGVSLQPRGGSPRSDQPLFVPSTSARPDYFEVMGTELVEGRAFQAGDAGTDRVIIDRDLARFLWPDGHALGKSFRLDDGGSWLEVVGVVRDLRLMGRDQRQGPGQILYPASPEEVAWPHVALAVRSRGDPEALLPEIRKAARVADPLQPLSALRTAAQDLSTQEQKPRFLVTLMTLLATVAVTLAAVGLYGTLSYAVNRRRRELGIRVALGADRDGVRGMVLGEGLRVALLGILMGVLGALLASGVVERLLYQVAPRDPTVLVGTAALFLAVTLVASFLPARRATRVDPVEMLRTE